MHCLCGRPAKDRKVTSSNNKNFGRTFFVCASVPQNCNFFQYADEPLSSSNRSSFGHASRQNQAPSSSSLKRPAVKLYLDAYDEATGTFWFVIYPSNTEIVKLIQKMDPNMYQYNNGVKIWMMDFTVYDTFLNELEASETNYIIEEVPKFVVRGIKTFMKTRDVLLSDPELNLSNKMLETLLPFQKEGVKFVVKRNGRALIGDEMGCGKTLQAIAVLQHYRTFWPALIMVPPTLVDQWVRELRQHIGSDLNASDLKVIKKGNDVISGKICVVSYTALEGLVEKRRISTDRFGVVIADESHQLKSKEAKRTNNALPFLRAAHIALCLTGTPSTNRPVELYTQLNGLLPTIFSDYDAFTRRYCDAKPSRFGGGMDVKGASNEKELNLILKSLVMIRRLKDEVVKLPDKNREILRVEPDPLFMDQLKNCKNDLKAVDDAIADPRNDYDTKQQLQSESRKILINYINVTGLAKVNRVKEELVRIIGELKEKNCKKSPEVVVVPKGCEDLFEDHVEQVSKDQIRTNLSSSSYQRKDCNGVSSKQILVPRKKTKKKRSRIILDDSDSDSVPDLEHPQDLVESVQHGVTEANDVIIIDGNGDYDEMTCRKGTKKKKEEPRDVWKAILNNDVSPLKPKKSRSSVTDRKKGDAWGALKKKVKKSNTSVGEKILIFGHHKSVMDSLEDCIKDMNLSHIRIDGDVSVAHRDNLINQFQTEESVEIALLSITACGTGLNLTKASIVIFAEISWSVGNMLQAEDRVHRIGQNADTVRIIYVLAGWSDDIVWGQIQKKHEVINATVGMGNSNKSTATNNKKSACSTTNNKKSPCSKAQPSISQYMHIPSCKDTQSNSAQSVISSTSIEISAVPANESMPTSASTSLEVYGSRSLHSSTSIPAPLYVPVTAASPSLPSGAMKTVDNTISNKRPLSPATKERIEANKLRALERQKSKCVGNMQPLMNVSSLPVPRTEEPRQKSSMQSTAPYYSFTTANKTTVDIDEGCVQYVERSTDIFQNLVFTQSAVCTFDPIDRNSSALPEENAGMEVADALKSQAMSEVRKIKVSVTKRSID